jgi:hypothetical protein
MLASVFDGAAAAYSLRIPAGSTYSGPLVRVRRSSDNAEQDIAALLVADANGNKWLDTVALLAFVGSGSGFVTTWYDQSGFGRHLTQTTAANQPSIVTAGAVVTENGRPVLQFDGLNDALSSAAGVANTTMANRAFTMAHVTFGVNSQFGWTGNGVNGAASVPRLYLQRDSFSYNNLFTVVINASSGGRVLTYGHDGVMTASAWRDGQLMGTGTEPVLASFGSGGYISVPRGIASSVDMAGAAAECVVFSSALSTAARQTLERSQGTAYGITVS